MRVWIDAGHGGHDPGSCAYGRREKDCTLAIGTALAQTLNSMGVTVAQTRATDTYVDIDSRAEMANKWGADYFVSIHLNAGGGNGLETYRSVVGGPSRKLGECIQRELLKMGYRDRGVKTKAGTGGKDYYGVIRETKAPAVLVEAGFVDSQEDMRRYNPGRIAERIAAGILAAISKDAPVLSDTTQDVTLARGDSYHVKLTSPIKPAFTVGNSTVLQTFTGRSGGDEYIFGVRAVGTPGTSTGVYANAKLLFKVTIK